MMAMLGVGTGVSMASWSPSAPTPGVSDRVMGSETPFHARPPAGRRRRERRSRAESVQRLVGVLGKRRISAMEQRDGGPRPRLPHQHRHPGSEAQQES
jgi:hypothetical protein